MINWQSKMLLDHSPFNEMPGEDLLQNGNLEKV
jgi:hypothetical protein